MSEGFTRTPTGIVGKWRFYPIPTIWVEGPTDIFFFAPLVDDLNCRIEPFYGCKNAKALVDGLITHDLPYLIVLDGDYDVLVKSRAVHKRAVRLQRYSFENYLWESEPINRACHRCAQSGERENIVGPEFNRINEHLAETLRTMVEVDVAARRSDPAPKVLPDRVERLLVNSRSPNCCPIKIDTIIQTALPGIKLQALESAKDDVEKYLKQRRLADLLKGHVLFGILRLVFTRTASAIKGSKVIVEDDALTQLLSDATWKRTPSQDHKRLRTKIRKNVKELMPLYPQPG